MLLVKAIVMFSAEEHALIKRIAKEKCRTMSQEIRFRTVRSLGNEDAEEEPEAINPIITRRYA